MQDDTLSSIANLSNAILTLAEHGIAVEAREADGACTMQGKTVTEDDVIAAAELLERDSPRAAQ